MGIRLELKKKYAAFELDLRFETEQKRIGILGASGAGKSLLLKSIAGISDSEEGRIILEGRCLLDSKRGIRLKPQERSVGYLFQDYALFPGMSVLENVMCGIRKTEKSGFFGSGKKEEKRRLALSLLESFRLLSLAKRMPGHLSGGEKQRVALLRILASRPRTILLDEPFSALDAYLRDQMMENLSEMLSDFPGMVFMVSHSRDEIYRFAEEILVMDQGRILQQGETRAVFRAPSCRRAAELSGCKNISRIRRLSKHEIFAEDFGIRLHFRKSVPENISYIGYRAHDFEMHYGEYEVNCLPLSLVQYAELPFERNYYLRAGGSVALPETSGASPESSDPEPPAGRIAWFLQRGFYDIVDQRGIPPYLRFLEDKVLFFPD